MNNYLDLFYESVMTPTPYSSSDQNSEMPSIIFSVFDDNKEPVFSSRGVIITAMSSQAHIDNYACNLYNLVKNASEVYSIIPELYTQAVTKLDNDEYYKYIKDHGILHKPADDMDTESKVYDDILDNDPDFEVETSVNNEAIIEEE